MAGVWTKRFTRPTGNTDRERFDLGPAGRHVDTDEGAEWGVLRAGFPGAGQIPAERWVLELHLPDQGTVITPIDLPCCMPVELPAHGWIYPETPPAAARDVVLSAARGTPANISYCALRSVSVAILGAVTLPQWVTAVTICEQAASAVWLDSAGAALCTFAGTAQPRPRSAHSLRVIGSASEVLLHYTE